MKEERSPFLTSEPEVLCRLLQIGLEPLRAEMESGDSPPAETVVKVIAGYELFRELGRGGSGVVYLARQPGLRRLVALKILGGGQFEDRTVRQRFQREAELVAALQHPRIVRIYEYGIWENLPYYSMQYVEGTNLQERLQARQLSWQQATQWAASIAETVDFAHRKGVLHRDLKPANILIDLDEQLHLTDFGLARRIEEAQGLTLIGTVVGTPHYIAPEVLSSYGRDVSPAADLYAIGTILYEMLAGIPPFTGKNLAEISEDIRRRDPIPPSRIRSGIPRQLDAICLKALRKRPHQRYASAQELAEALTSLAADNRLSGSSSLRPARAMRLPKFSYEMLIRLLAIAFVLLIGGMLVSTHLGSKAPAFAAKAPALLAPDSIPLADQPWTDTLGLKFAPAGSDGVLFGVWDVRVKDFRTFVDATGYDATAGMVSLNSGGWKPEGDTWKSPGFSQTDDCPVVGVSWNDANAFCDWLTQKERATGKLASSQSYRLPTDAEWSRAIGLSESDGGTPVSKSGVVSIFPWGTHQWPPPKEAGNYAGTEARDADWPSDRTSLDNQNDQYPRTSPVGSFVANVYGLYDMGGNVWNWCEDEYNPGVVNWRVLRGASWSDGGDPNLLRSSFRFPEVPDIRGVNYGFRVIVVVTP